ncbi:MAG: ABC transporter permease [Candidatus Binatia bacterium]
MNFHFVATKILRALITLWLVVTFAFIILRLSGDPMEALLGDDADPEVIAYYHHKYGLDKPLYVQYLSYFVNIMNGDLGITFQDERDALEVVVEAIPRTLQLGFTAFLLGLAIGIPLGVVAALNRNKLIDRFTMGFAVFGFSIPNFFQGILMILLFSLWLRLLPSSGAGGFLHLIMPAITLGTSSAGSIARFARSAMLEVLNKSYMRTANAKGVPKGRRVRWHALPNAAIPIVTIVGFRLGDLVAGSIITETVFAWPGVGRLLVTSVSNRDLAVVQAILLIVGTTMTLANLSVDLIYSWIDPRIRHSSTAEEE